MTKKIAWSFSGAAARAIALFRMAESSIEFGEKPDVVIGSSSGALIAPIIAVSYKCPELLHSAIKMAETLDSTDMFPYKGNMPMYKNGKPSIGGILRGFTHNHLGWQDIRPMYKKIFKEEHFQVFKKSDIKCIAFGVKGVNWSPIEYVLNDAKSLDDMIDMIECSSRITPFVQPMSYDGFGHVDGGYISFNPSMWLFDKFDLKEVITFYSNQIHGRIPDNPKWDKSILSVTNQAMHGMSHWLGVKDAIIEKIECKLRNINYLRIEAPDGYTDEVYETDDNQLIALGLASKKVAEDAWKNYLKTKNLQ
jgi:predicted acylesterase/phospholipase RssA